MHRQTPNYRIMRLFNVTSSNPIGEINNGNRINLFLFNIMKDGFKRSSTTAFWLQHFASIILLNIIDFRITEYNSQFNLLAVAFVNTKHFVDFGSKLIDFFLPN